MKKIYWSFLTVVISLQLMTGCANDGTTGDEGAGEFVDFSVKASGFNFDDGRTEAKRSEVYRDTVSLDWARSQFVTNFAASSVDFAVQQAVLLTGGTFPSGGYGVSVESVVDYGEYLRLNVRLERAGSSCTTSQAFVHPYEFLEINSRKEIVIHESYVIEDCEI